MMNHIGSNSRVGCVLDVDMNPEVPWDRSVYGHTLINYDSIWNLNGRYFDGVNDYINCGNDNSFDFKNFTIEMWVKTVDDNSHRTLVSKTYLEWDFRISTTNLYQFYKSDGAGSYETHSKNIGWTHNVWHHVVNTFLSSTKEMKTYIDGELKWVKVCNSNSLSNPTSHDVTIGKRSGGGHYFTGSINSVRIYKYLLSPEKIKSHWINTKTG